MRLLIVLCVLTLRKTTGQVFMPRAYTQSLPSLTLHPSTQLNVPPLQYFDPQPVMTQFLRNSGNKVDLPQARDSQTQREVVIPAPVAKMDDRPLSQPSNDDRREVTAKIDLGELNVDPEPVSERTEVNQRKTTTTEKIPEGFTEVNTHKNVVEGIKEKPGSASENVSVSVDQRASFSGDKCPTGYIRIAGSAECVQPD